MRRPTLLLPLMLAACTVGPNYRRPVIAGAAGTWLAAADTRASAAAPWQSLGDPLLSELITTALAQNLDVRAADARLREARALRDAAAGRRLPEIDATASAQQLQLSRNGELPIKQIPGFDRNFSLFDAGFDASWEIDLWGGTRRAVEAATRRVDQAAAQAREARLQTVAEIARTYAALRGDQAALAAARADADAQAGIARLVNQRYRAGESARFDDSRASSQARTTAASLPAIEAAMHADAYALAVLTGRPPEALAARLLIPAPLPMPPSNVGVGLRSDVLRHRPDVAAAEAELAAATADIGVETANLFPKVSLMGGIGVQARKPGDLPSNDSERFQLGPSLRWAIFDAGRIRAQIRAADARADQAAARYTKTVLGALADSESALNRFAAAQAELRSRAAALADADIALGLAGQRYRAGEDDLTQLLDAQSARSAASTADVRARQQLLASFAALLKALGGGLDNPA